MQNSLKIVAILNVTPDSFSDGGKYYDTEDAVGCGIQMLEKGVDIIDVGGESVRPGSTGVDVDEEIRRTIPVIKGILKNNPDAVISIDTTKSMVADEALKSGAKIVNDVSGGLFDPEIWKVVAQHGAKYILMHTSGTPDMMQSKTDYVDVVVEVKNYLFKRVELASQAGVKEIILDPGIGFGKTAAQNISLIKHIGEFSENDNEVMIGLSRKSFLGKLFNLDVEERDFHTALFEFYAAIGGVSYIRTHNINNAMAIKKVWNTLNV